MDKKALYIGIFLNDESTDLLTNMQDVCLEHVIENMHCTFKFMPSDEDVDKIIKRNLIGHKVKLLVCGYGHDENNSGFTVIIPEHLNDIYDNDCIAHITVSISNNGKPKDTKNLIFRHIPGEVYLHGTVGICYTTGIEK